MNKYMYALFTKVKKKGDISSMKNLYDANKNDCIIAFEYVKMLLKKRKYDEARPVLLQLLDTRNRNYALLELGKIEAEQGNVDIARGYFCILLKEGTFKDKSYAMLELGRLEESVGNIDKARYCFNELMNKDKSCAILELGILEFSQGNIELAQKYFESLLNSQNRAYALLCLVRLFVKQEDYMNAYKYVEILLKDKKKLNISFYFIIPYIVNALSIEMKNVNMFWGYNTYQLFDYDEYVAVEHIIEGHKDEFSSDIDIYRLFNGIKPMLIDEYKVRNLSINDIYNIPYPNIGNSCDILRVVTLPNTKDILTMYPLTKGNQMLDDGCLGDNSHLSLKRVKQ